MELLQTFNMNDGFGEIMNKVNNCHSLIWIIVICFLNLKFSFPFLFFHPLLHFLCLSCVWRVNGNGNQNNRPTILHMIIHIAAAVINQRINSNVWSLLSAPPFRSLWQMIKIFISFLVRNLNPRKWPADDFLLFFSVRYNEHRCQFHPLLFKILGWHWNWSHN